MTDILIDPPDAARRRAALVDHLVTTGAIRSTRWRDAFTAVPRHLFLARFARFDHATSNREHIDGTDPSQRERWLDVVYSDDALSTQHDAAGTATSSSTQPTVMAFMLEALNVHNGSRVLEVGTGTGYNSALLCHRLGDALVTSVDIDSGLVDQARAALAELGYHPTLAAADGLAGYAPRAPYDRIIGTCSTHRVPTAWVQQTTPGGVIVANIGFGVVPLHVADDKSATGRFLTDVAAFIEARPADSTTGPISINEAIDLAYGIGDERHPTDLPDGIDDEEFWFAFQVTRPGLFWFEVRESDDDNARARFLVDPKSRSWYRARTELPDGGTVVHQAGRRRLWDEMEAAHAWWTAAGRPAHDRLGLTVEPDGRHVLWVDEPGQHELTLT